MCSSDLAAADAAQEIMSGELKRLYLAHLSRECNKPELAKSVMAARLQKLAAHHVALELTHQHEPCATVTL